MYLRDKGDVLRITYNVGMVCPLTVSEANVKPFVFPRYEYTMLIEMMRWYNVQWNLLLTQVKRLVQCVPRLQRQQVFD